MFAEEVLSISLTHLPSSLTIPAPVLRYVPPDNSFSPLSPPCPPSPPLTRQSGRSTPLVAITSSMFFTFSGTDSSTPSCFRDMQPCRRGEASSRG